MVISNPGSRVVIIAKQQKIAVTKALPAVPIDNIYDERSPHSPAFENGESVNAVHYRTMPDRMDKIGQHASVQESGEKHLKSS